MLDDDELKVLETANTVYMEKGFEYFIPEDALRGFSRAPDLTRLDQVADKLIGHAGTMAADRGGA